MRHTSSMTSVFCCALGLIGAPALAAPMVGVSFSGDQGAVLYDISAQTGQAVGGRPLGIDRLVGTVGTPNGTLYALTSHTAPVNPASLFRINAATGSATLVGSTGLASVAEGDMAIDPLTGVLYGGYSALNNFRQLFTINPTTGQATLLPGTVYGDSSAMAFDAAGNLYVLDCALSKLYGVNKQTGNVVSTVALSLTLGGTAGMSVDPGTGTFYVADGGTGGTGMLYTLDPASGALSAVGSTGLSQGVSGLAFLPEPATFILFAICAAFSLRRRY